MSIKDRYCFYCHSRKPDEGFLKIPTPGYPNLVRYKCPTCQENHRKAKEKKREHHRNQ